MIDHQQQQQLQHLTSLDQASASLGMADAMADANIQMPRRTERGGSVDDGEYLQYLIFNFS